MHIERGSRGLSLDVVLRIANTLGKTMDEIFLPPMSRKNTI
ncbi:MAG TPA: helix-turn-helix transcriptional regulator [Firmicutes bacterium]|nr:helix-turn-helix transcriptional regulator [Bacillota bacterium]